MFLNNLPASAFQLAPTWSTGSLELELLVVMDSNKSAFKTYQPVSKASKKNMSCELEQN
jgi:hypothetical protein